jgi:polyphosphate kinase-like protein
MQAVAAPPVPALPAVPAVRITPVVPALDDPSLYINRELSWLEFNRRVLGEAQDKQVPLLERLKFLAIFSANLDEYFMVRVGGLQQKVEARIAQGSGADRIPPIEQLEGKTKGSAVFMLALPGRGGADRPGNPDQPGAAGPAVATSIASPAAGPSPAASAPRQRAPHAPANGARPSTLPPSPAG